MKLAMSALAAILALSVGGERAVLAQSAQAIALYSPGAQQTLNQLSSLDHLPGGVWKYHTADIAHGEDAGLDDSSWPAAKEGTEYAKEGMWLRSWIEVPKLLNGYDLTGTAIWFHASIEAHLPVTQIVYVNGQQIAMADNIEPVEIIPKVKPGDRILVAVKALPTVHPKRFNGTQITIRFAAGRPNPLDVRDEILSATLLLPSLDPSANHRDVLEKAIAAVDAKALNNGDQAKFDASLRASQAILEPLRPLIQKAAVSLDGNAHIDAAWLWPWTESVDVVRRTFSTALQLMNEYPTYVFTQSAAAYNEWLAQKYPDVNDDIARRIKEGRWEVVGGMWVEPDLNLPDGESTARSIFIGKRWFQQHYGVDVRVGWNPDSFGYTWQLPQIYKKSGIDYFITQKMSWNETNQLPLKLFWWESPDGSKVLTYFPRGYANRDVGALRLSSDLAKARQYAPGITETLDLYGVGDHGGGPTRMILDQASRWMQPGKVAPQMRFGTTAQYFVDIEKQIAPTSKEWNYVALGQGYHAPDPVAGKIAIPTWKDELYLETHRGVYTTQGNHKRNMRQTPEWTLNAEKLASLAWLDGDTYPAARLEDAWKKISFNNFHDLAAGSGVAQIYKEAQQDYDDVHWITQEISEQAVKTLAARVDTRVPTGVPVLIFNPLSWERDGFVTVDVQMPAATNDVAVLDTSGLVLPSQVISRNRGTNAFKVLVDAKRVPSLGYKVLRVVPGHRPVATDLRSSAMTLENARLRVTIDPRTGCITSLFDKASQFEALAAGACGNELQAFKDTPKLYDAWNIDRGTLDQPPVDIHQVNSVKLLETGPLRSVIRVTRTWQNSHFVQDLILYAGARQVEIDNDFDWHENHVLLKAAFPLAATSPFATYEIPFGTIERPTTRNNSFEKARFEVSAQNWADLGDGKHGFALINEAKYGYDAVGNVLRLTLLRSPVYPDPDADRGHNHFRYALYPHAGTWKDAMAVQYGNNFNYDLIAKQVAAHAGTMPAEHSFVSTSANNIVITAMKKSEDTNSLEFHLYEWKGTDSVVAIKVPAGASAAVETNLLEKPEGGELPLQKDIVRIHVRPFEIVAFRVDYPKQVTAQTP